MGPGPTYAAIAQPLISLLLSSAVVMGSPGPATMSVTALGASFGFRRSLAYLAGIVLGTGVVLLVVALGLVSALTSIPRLAPTLVALSALYMVYLAVRIATAPPLSTAARQENAPRFAGGFLLALANPKAYVAIAAVYAGARFGMIAPVAETSLKLVVLGGMIVVIHLAWLLAGSSFARVLHHPAASRAVNLVFAAMLLVSTGLACLS